MQLVYLIIGLSLIEFFAFGGLVGRARVKTGVKAPAVSGDEEFERYYRSHYNTMEQLVVFIPAMLLFGNYVSANWAAGLGAVFIIGRVLYLVGYVADPPKRTIGFMLSWLPCLILLFGGTGALAWQLFTH